MAAGRWFGLVRDLGEKYPGKFRLVDKRDSRLMRLIGWLLKPINPNFMDKYVTTIGYTVYIGADRIATTSGYKILRHEAVHIADYHKYGLWFSFSYLFLPIPFFFTLRAFWEFRGYRESMLVKFEHRGELTDAYLDRLADNFTGPSYAWMLVSRRWTLKILREYRSQILAGV